MRHERTASSRTRRAPLALVAIGLIVFLPAGAIVAPMVLSSINHIDTARLEAAAQAYPNFTAEQRQARLQDAHAQMHPLWKTLSWSGKVARAGMFAKRFVQMRYAALGVAAPAATTQSSAVFLGNLTVINGPSGAAISLQRQASCSLTLYTGTYTFSLNPTIQIQATTPSYEKTLHAEAGLTTTADAFATGCVEPTLGIGQRQAVYLGETTAKLYMGAASGYDMMAGSNALYYGTIDPLTQQVHSFNIDLSEPGINGVVAGDLNGDGLADIVGIDESAAAITVWLAKPDGSISAPTSYSLTGNTTEAAVLADMNGDGKVDVVVATRSTAGQETISVLMGKGDGSLNAPQSFAVATPTSLGSHPLVNLIAADLRGTGHQDVVGSNGLLLLNDGTGTFTVGTSAFAPEFGTSNLGPALVAADFNKDGKMDLAVDNGAAIHILLGNGAGAFTAGKSYVSINDVGYMSATDLDGDGNVDLYVGVANGGFFGSDQTGASQAYALMGNGDGSFQGAPFLPFVYTGNNLADLDGDKIMDAVGVNADLSFTSYLGDGKGGFAATSTFSYSPITLGGQSYTVGGIDSFAIGDLNGDGVADLAYLGTNFNGPGGTPGVFIALGNGHGGFATPTFYSVASTLAAGDFDINWTISSLHLADINHDGKADLLYNYADASSHNNTVNFGTVAQLGNGDGTFRAPQSILLRSAPYTGFDPTYGGQVERVADLNKDGNPDLVLVTQSGTIDHTLSTYVATIQVALGKGDGTFSAPTTIVGPDIMVQSYTDVIPASVAVADMNGDGIPDIVALGSSTSYDAQVAVALGNGDGTFKAPQLKTYTGQYLNNSQGLAVADFDGDGKLDVAIGDPFIPTNSGISLGNGDGTLQSAGGATATLPQLTLNLLVSAPMIALDLNGDGVADLIAGNVELLSTSTPSSPPPPTPDFAVAASPAAASVASGKSATSTLTVTPSGGFNQTVSLSCSGLPSGATCTFAPATVAVNAVAGTSTLTIATTTRTARSSSPARTFDPFLPGGVLLAGIGMPFAIRRRRRSTTARSFGLVAVLLVGAAVLHGCGGGGSSGSGGGSGTGGGGSGGGTTTGTPAGTSTVTITATGGSTTHTVSFALTVS